MSDTSPILALPFIQPAQAQKHVTHNEALRLLDAIVQLAVLSRSLREPPPLPQEGARYIVAPGGLLEWAGHDDEIALRENGTWAFLVPRPGWRAQDMETGEMLVFDGTAWAGPGERPLRVAELGVNAAPDAFNRLNVSGDATLLSHAGGGHQVKVNKAAPGDTASLLFQTGFSGRAEMGLAGEENFSVKVSPDGVAWVTALRLSAADGRATFGQVEATGYGGAGVQAGPGDITPGRLMRADFGYSPGNLLGPVALAGGQPEGAVIERGSGPDGHYTRWADGTQVCWAQVSVAGVAQPSGTLFASAPLAWNFPAPFAGDASGTASADHADAWAGLSGVTATGAMARAFATAALGAVSLCLLAVGRWN